MIAFAMEPKTNKPGNVFYFRPYPTTCLVLYIFLGAFLCSSIGTRSTQIIAWTAYVFSAVLLVLIDPLCCVESQALDENSNPVTLRRPLVGFKSHEVIIPLDPEGVSQNEYAGAHGETDERLSDGFRYGFALVRV